MASLGPHQHQTRSQCPQLSRVPLPNPSAPTVPLPVPLVPRGVRTVAAPAVLAWLEVAEPRQPPHCQP